MERKSLRQSFLESDLWNALHPRTKQFNLNKKPVLSLTKQNSTKPKRRSIGMMKMAEVETQQSCSDMKSDYDSLLNALDAGDESPVKLKRKSCRITVLSPPNLKERRLSVIEEGSDESLRDSKVFSAVS